MNPTGVGALSFGTGDDLVAFVNSKNGKIINATQSKNNISQLPSRISNALVENGFNIFRGIIEKRKSFATSSVQFKSFLLESSKALRQVIVEQILLLEQYVVVAVETNEDHNSKMMMTGEEQHYLEICEVFKRCHSVWHLCEIFVLNDSVLVGGMIIDWYQTHIGNMELRASHIEADVIKNRSNSPHFWPLVFDCVFRGDMITAWKILSNHTIFSTENRITGIKIQDLSSDLSKIFLQMPQLPSDASFDNESSFRILEFRSSWMQWREMVNTIVENHACLRGEFADPKFFILGRILLGDVQQIIATYYEMTNPPELYVLLPLILYCAPFTKKEDLANLVYSCGGKIAAEKSNEWKALLYVFEGNITAAVQTNHATFHQKWVDCHLGEIMSHAGVLESPSLGQDLGPNPEAFRIAGMELDIREHFILQYVMDLCLNPSVPISLIQPYIGIAFQYLCTLDKEVPTSYGAPKYVIGSLCLENIFNRIPLDAITEPLVEDCKRYCSEEMAISLCLQKARSLWPNSLEMIDANENFDAAEALLWIAKAGKKHTSDLLNRVLYSGNLKSLKVFVSMVGRNRRRNNFQKMNILDDILFSTSSFDESPFADDAVLRFFVEYEKVTYKFEQASLALKDHGKIKPSEYSISMMSSSSPSTSLNNGELIDSWKNQRKEALEQLCYLFRTLKEFIPEKFIVEIICDAICWEIPSKVQQEEQQGGLFSMSNRNINVYKSLPELCVKDCRTLISCLEEAIRLEPTKELSNEQQEKRELTCLLLTKWLANAIVMENNSQSI